MAANVFIATADKSAAVAVRQILSRAGYALAGEAADGPQALRLIRTRRVDLLIVDQDLPGLSGLALAEIAEQDRLAPAILLASGWQPGLLNAAGVYGLLVKPVQEPQLLALAEGALVHYRRLDKLEQEVERLKDSIAGRKAIERAKGIVMETMKLPEAEAYRRIQRLAMDKCVPMRSIAEAIITAHELKMGK